MGVGDVADIQANEDNDEAKTETSKTVDFEGVRIEFHPPLKAVRYSCRTYVPQLCIFDGRFPIILYHHPLNQPPQRRPTRILFWVYMFKLF